MNERYDIAVVGGGLAGLSLLYHLNEAGRLTDRRIALIDPERKGAHDRTWSFWEKEEGPFEHLVHHHWPEVDVANREKHRTCVLAPYTYKLIRSNDFYAEMNSMLEGLPQVEHLKTRVLDVNGQTVNTSTGSLTAEYIFDSRPTPYDYRELDHPYLDQHFRGWYVETAAAVFDPNRATLMDFRTPQRGETRFLYVLPFSTRRALVEVAIFSNDHLSAAEYDRIMADYLAEHWTANYQVTHTEAGNIPMTTEPYPLRDGNHIYIGLGGGAARPSTGYTFYGLQRQLMSLAADFPRMRDLRPWSARHTLYDATLLRILQDSRLPGDEVFVDLFDRNPPARVLAFLNGESTLAQELLLMSTTPVGTFGKTFVGELKNFL